MKILFAIVLSFYLINIQASESNIWMQNSLKVIIKKTYLAQDQFPYSYYCDMSNNLIYPIQLEPKIYNQFGELIDNQYYIKHTLIDHTYFWENDAWVLKYIYVVYIN